MVSKNQSYSVSVISRKDFGLNTPALLIRISTPPNVSEATFTKFFAVLGSAISPAK